MQDQEESSYHLARNSSRSARSKARSINTMDKGILVNGIYPLNREKVFRLFPCTESAGSQQLPRAVSVDNDVATETHVDSRTRSQIPIDKYEPLHQPSLDLVESSENSIDVVRHSEVKLQTASDDTIVIPMKVQSESEEVANVSDFSNLLEDTYLHTSVASYISNLHASAEFPKNVNDDEEYCMLANDPNSTESLENLEDIRHPMTFELPSHSPFATQKDCETGHSLNEALDLTSKTRPQIGQLLLRKRIYPNSVYPLDLSTQSNCTPASTLRFGGLELIRPLQTPINNAKRTTKTRKMVSTIVTGSPEMRRKQELEKAKHLKEEKKREREIKKRLREAKKIDTQIKRRLKEEMQLFLPSFPGPSDEGRDYVPLSPVPSVEGTPSVVDFTLIRSQNSSETDTDDASFRKPLSRPEVCVECGCVRGKFESGRRKSYDAFYGIPYAEPPVGKLRFENTVPHSGWSGYWDASYPRDDCLQKNFFLNSSIFGSEDCLFLNVYRPYTWNRKNKLLVLVGIHGGSFIDFSSKPELFGPEYLMDNGEVILVTMNYRLGILGFLCSGDEAVKGNFGLKDQQMALQWVAKNIEYFGGDSSSVTLVGVSAGATSTHLHMMNSKSQALFHRVILMSGTALAPYMYPIDHAAQFRTVAHLTGLKDFDTDSTYNLAYQLKKVDAKTFLLTLDMLYSFFATPPAPLRPCIERDWEGAFMTEDPRKVWAEGRFVQKPILVGTVPNEGAALSIITLNDELLDQFNRNIYNFLPIQMEFKPRYMSDVLKFYFGDRTTIDASNQEAYFKMFGDRMLRYPLINLVDQYVKYADVEKNPIFIYEFDFESSYNFINLITGTEEYFEPSNGNDFLYAFTMASLFEPFEVDTPESRMSDILVRTVVNFVVQGEVKVWRTLRPCTIETSFPSCDRQVFQRHTKLDPNQVMVSISNEIDSEMFKFWSKIDNGVRLHSIKRCTGSDNITCF
ncbi:carboxylic ester hydrolase-like [Phlebotomus papatasi]|uniref:carboxylic ester hydrolase-like n=1 Tax=Phlebotomus papatasi TaxID=29031 RepID=UPI0024836C00|nr:carboxylic ester hydrolase-like [Phlebotomus papatasi]